MKGGIPQLSEQLSACKARLLFYNGIWLPEIMGTLRHTVEWRYSSTHALPQHFMQVGDQFHSPLTLPLGPRPSLGISEEEINLLTLLVNKP